MRESSKEVLPVDEAVKAAANTQAMNFEPFFSGCFLHQKSEKVVSDLDHENGFLSELGAFDFESL